MAYQFGSFGDEQRCIFVDCLHVRVGFKYFLDTSHRESDAGTFNLGTDKTILNMCSSSGIGS